MSETLKVGDKVYFVRSGHSGRTYPEWLTVEKVGRKWVQLSRDYRLPIGSMYIDGRGYASPGRCYMSQEDYERHQLRRAQWQLIREFVDRRYGNPPEGCDLDAVANALGFTLKVEEPVT